VTGHIATGRLIDLSPPAPLDVALHWQFTRLAAPALKPLTKAIRAEAARTLIPPA
jgi:LysR family transcriptional regulator (chromosome initiation inhibitor)